MGAGGIGEVYLAQDAKPDHRVALRYWGNLIPNATSADEGGRPQAARNILTSLPIVRSSFVCASSSS